MNYVNSERISSGIEGLDVILKGGFVQYSINTILGDIGTGKTLTTLAYISECISKKDHILHLSFDQTSPKIVAEAESICLHFGSYFKDPEDVLIHYIELDEYLEFMTDKLPALAQNLKKRNIKHTRIVLDSITPILWEFPSEKDQRKVLSTIYSRLGALGTVLQTVGEVH